MTDQVAGVLYTLDGSDKKKRGQLLPLDGNVAGHKLRIATPSKSQFSLKLIPAWHKQKEATADEKVKPSKPPSEEYSRFEQLAREIIAVPKRELDKRAAAYRRKKVEEKKRKAA